MILGAALLLAATSIIQNYYAHRGLLREAEERAEKELTISQLRIENITGPVETAVMNTAWMVEMNLSKPDTMFTLLRNLVETNPVLAEAAIGFEANYYPEKGYWFEPAVARRGEDPFEEMVLGSPLHDYFNLEWYAHTVRTGENIWSEPYYDESAGRTTVVSYTTPVKDSEGRIVAVISADLTVEWLTDLLKDIQPYPNTYGTLESRNGQMLVSPPDRPLPNDAVYYAMPIESTGWLMSIFIPRNEILRNVNRITWLISLLQLLGLALLAIIAMKSVKDQSHLALVQSKKDKLDNELRIARDIQMSMIPKTFPPFPERKEIDMTAAMLSAKEVGGDLYDFFIRNDKLYFCIGDVSGKGVPAALVMAVTRSLFRSVTAHETNPMRIVSLMNESMSDMNDNDMFVTFFCGVLDLNNGHIRYCNAGHNAPFILDGPVEELSVMPNLPLGVKADMVYREQEVTLSAGSTLFLYTDGLTEAENASHELFGTKRAKDLLSSGVSAESNQESIIDGVTAFVGDAEHSDDLTLLIIRYMGNEDNKVKERRLVLHNDIQQIPQLAEFILTIAEEKHLNQSLSMSLNLALEEAVTNVILYAYPKGADGLVTIEAILREKSLDFIVSDSGRPFDPTAVPEVDTDKGLDERPIGGLGIHLVRSIMDEVHYKRTDEKNILSMTKTI